MEYNNPNDPWMYDHYKGLDDKERVKAILLQVVSFFVMTMVCLLLCALLGSCTTTKYVTVPKQHTEHHWHTDSIHQTDSIIKETTTTIMQLDSAAMAKYGINLKSAERAWLVKTAELERQIQQLMQLSATHDTVRDTIPYPVEVPKEVPAELTWWQQTRIHLANILLWLLLISVVIYGVKWYLKSKRP